MGRRPQDASKKDLDQLKKKRKPGPAARLRRMHDLLLFAYGSQSWWPAKTPFEVILGAYLTQSTSWKAVERALENLRAADALSQQGIRAISVGRLQELIRPSGFVTRKAPAIKEFVRMVDAEFGGSLETLAARPTKELRALLLRLPGVGPETADAILLYALGHSTPVADEYLRRIAERHRLLNPSRNAIVADMKPWLNSPSEHSQAIHRACFRSISTSFTH